MPINFTFDTRSSKVKSNMRRPCYTFDSSQTLAWSDMSITLTSFTFDARQRWSQICDDFAIPFILVKGVVKYANNFYFTFDARQRWSQICDSFAIPLILVKGVVKYLPMTLTSHLTLDKREVKYVTVLLYLWSLSKAWSNMSITSTRVKGVRQKWSQICDGFAIPLILFKGVVKYRPITLTSHLTLVKDEVQYVTALL